MISVLSGIGLRAPFQFKPNCLALNPTYGFYCGDYFFSSGRSSQRRRIKTTSASRIRMIATGRAELRP
jgi:hypothetical protein